MPAETKKPTNKRKRVKEEDRSVKLAGKLHHCAKEVKKSAKKAKDFEIRKLVKRLKGLRAKDTAPPELADLEEQLVLLKEIDHDAIANTALKTKIRKDKKLSEDTDLESAIAKELTHVVTPATPGSNLAKVQGRLLSHKVLATEVHAVLEEIRFTVFPELKKPVAAKEEDEEEESDESGGETAPPAKRAKVVATPDEDDDDGDGESEGDESLNGRAALSDEEEVADDGWESGSIDSGPGATDSEDADSGDEDDSEAGEEGESDGGEDDEQSAQTSRQTAQSKASSSKANSKAGESTFLPSLSVGFTRGDSDASDIDEAEVSRADGVRKNRRGQRARRAIWEKKYGRNANHVKKQQEAEKTQLAAKGGPRNGRDNSRDKGKKPFGKPQQNRKPVSQQTQGRDSGWSQRVSTGQGPPPRSQAPSGPPARKKDDKPLHPSWEAKRKLKEKQSATIIPPQGKKIVF